MNPYLRAVSQFKGKKVLIFGLGLLGGGLGDARFFSRVGADVKITDKKSAQELDPSIKALSHLPLTYTLGGHSVDDIKWADYILRNPAVPVDHPLLDEAANLNKPVLMRSSLFVELAQVQTIGITGTRGKTTTTAMIHALCQRHSSKKILYGGNIAGVSDLELLHDITDPDQTIAILELSSWQLQGFANNHLSPDIAVITNLYPDHLNVYPDVESYYRDKMNILSNQTKDSHAVLNQNQPEFHQWAAKTPGTIHWFSDATLPPNLNLTIPGAHNRNNAAAALAVAKIFDWPENISIEVLNTFTGVPFRLQTIATKSGITYINDTTSTTPISAIKALEAYDRPPILICGGNDKNLPIDELATKINQSVKTLIILPGTGSDKLRPLLDSSISTFEATSMTEAVKLATENAVAGDTILLSPGFTSFGLFLNEFDRGDQFNQCVNDLA